ncbi:MAG: hypothetical protein CL528_01940 [Aequorivita sp.]|mgnify:CR=1 FL=1|nr:hypothetical protein [Aequorivita sp.]MBP40510.1 hypothetical protein [Aequorivita sp.]|tara:strand:- start:1930 stop:2175 length:246 start_codon:yes stop_codon:yes gene_type:complete
MERKLSFHDFKNLAQQEQYDLVFTQGDFINYYLKEEIRYVLYSLFKFFVEVEYNVSKNKISNLIAFEEGKLLDRYWILTEL